MKNNRFVTSLIAGGMSSLLLCSCQQLTSISGQQETLSEFSSYNHEDKSELIEDWHDEITLDNIRKSSSHCCYVRFQHELKSLSLAMKEADYKKKNSSRYQKIVKEYLNIANSNTDLKFMTDCMENQADVQMEVTTIRKNAIAALIALDDDELFNDLRAIFADTDYEYQVQIIIADGLIKYLPQHSSDSVKADLIYKAMLIKSKQRDYASMKEIEHLMGLCVNLSSINEAIVKSKHDNRILELCLELNLNMWRHIIKENQDFSEKDAKENIALLKSLVLPPPTERVDELVNFALCEIAPCESLSVLNSRFENKDSFDNLKNMLAFFYSLKSNASAVNNEKIAKLSDIQNIVKTTQKLSLEFINNKLEKLPIHEQKETYELYAATYPEQAKNFLCKRFVAGDASAEFYETAINSTLWMISKKIITGNNAEDLSNSIDKLLFSCRKRSDYRKIFQNVFSNKNSYTNLRLEMLNAVNKGDIDRKDDFVDCFILLISKFDGNAKIQSDSKFKEENMNAFEALLSSLDSKTILKIIAYMETKKEPQFLLEKIFFHCFRKNNCKKSIPHITIAGDLAYKHLYYLQKNPSLYQDYRNLFLEGISSKDDNLSLISADYYFRIATSGNSKEKDEAYALFSTRWPNMRTIPNNSNKKIQ